MSIIAVPIFVGSVDEVDAALTRAGRAVDAGARMIEWRVDVLADDQVGVNSALRLVSKSPAPCIVTCRHVSEGGSFGGDDAQRIALYEAVTGADERPRYIDIEHAAVERDPRWRRFLRDLHQRQDGRDLHTGVIMSLHDFVGRPAGLTRRVQEMTADPLCSVIKIVWRARSVRDNLEAFDLLIERRKPMIALCADEAGLMSRVLAPKFGGLLTFATDIPGMETAPGQPTIDDLRNLYRFDSIRPETKVYGVIGWPVGQSQSPRVHNTGFTAAEHDAVYLPLPVPPEWEHFKATVGALIDHPRLNFRGASVTIPHKQHLLRFVQERGGRADALCESTGAANTLIVGSSGAVSCANTDAPAAVESLCEGMGVGEIALAEKTIAVLGAGGVARAVVAGLAQTGAKVVIFNRTLVRADEVASMFHQKETANGGQAHVVAGKADAINCACFDVIVNCTSVGMAGGPSPGGLPLDLDADRAMNDTVTVFDTVYAPLETPLVRAAREHGARVITGDAMFLKQAAMQFKLWTGRELVHHKTEPRP